MDKEVKAVRSFYNPNVFPVFKNNCIFEALSGRRVGNDPEALHYSSGAEHDEQFPLLHSQL